MSRRLLSIVLLAVALVAIAPSAHGLAAADTFTVSERFPIDLTVFVSCADGGAGEFVQLIGTLHVLSSVTVDSNGGFRDKSVFNPQGVSGTGLTTGDKYQGTGTTTSVFRLTVGVSQTYVNSFLIIGQGSGNNFLVQETFHFTVNPNGELTVFFDNFSVECK